MQVARYDSIRYQFVPSDHTEPRRGKMKSARPIAKTLVAALVAACAVSFAVANVRERLRQTPPPDDGVIWVNSDAGVLAQYVRPGSPAANAGIQRGQVLRAIYFDGAYEEIRDAADVQIYLDEVNVGGSLVYAVERYNARGISMGVWEGDVKGIEPKPIEIWWELYLGLIGVVYLAIGLFVLLRQARAPYSTHFFWICVTAFLFHVLVPTYGETPEGTWQPLDRAVYITDTLALLLMAPLFVHFCAVFPARRGWLARRRFGIGLFYVPAAVLIALEVAWHLAPAGVVNLLDWRNALDTTTVVHFTLGFVVGDALLIRAYFRETSAILRQQLKWIIWGVGLAAVPFAAFYTWPYLMGSPIPTALRFLTVGPLIFVPLSFGYAIVRYRLMDVDVIVRRSFVHVVATATVGALYLLLLLAVGDAVQDLSPGAPVWAARAAAVALMLLLTILFAPAKTWLQQTADRLFYGERYTLRRGLGEFGRALAATSALEPLLDSLAARLKRMLSVEQVAIFVEDDASPDGYRLALSSGIEGAVGLPKDFRRWVRAHSSVNGYAVAEDEEASWNGLYYLVPCVVRDRLVAVVGVGRQTSDGSLVTSEDIEILRALSGYVAVAIENSLLLRQEQERARQLALLKQFSDSIIESVNVGILVIEASGRITVWNSALEEMLGISRSEAVGADALDIFNEEMIETIRAVSGVQGWVVEDVRHLYKFRTLTRDDRPIVINLSLAPFEDTARTLAGTLVVVEDVTDRVKLEEQLQQSDKLNSIGLLAAGVAHEVNTPLAGISSYTQMLLSQLPADDSKSRVLEKILTQTQRASGIVNNLLNFSRTSGTDFGPIDINRVLDDTLQLLELQLRKGNVEVVRRYAEELPEAYANAGKLQQVFMNLILNARDAMPDGGRLEIETESVDHMLVARVRDTGIGIAPANITKIYDPFFTTKGVGQGTGLGLALSYGIVQEHSGRIFVESQPGRGTTFTIKLPSRYRRLQAASD
jgi:PAS domain S-box-containing protein